MHKPVRFQALTVCRNRLLESQVEILANGEFQSRPDLTQQIRRLLRSTPLNDPLIHDPPKEAPINFCGILYDCKIIYKKGESEVQILNHVLEIMIHDRCLIS